jgi:hypothetical protein
MIPQLGLPKTVSYLVREKRGKRNYYSGITCKWLLKNHIFTFHKTTWKHIYLLCIILEYYRIFYILTCCIINWRELFSLLSLSEWAFSCSFLFVNLTGTNCGWLEIQKRHRIDRETESGIRCLGHLDGDSQPSLLLFSIFIL